MTRATASRCLGLFALAATALLTLPSGATITEDDQVILELPASPAGSAEGVVNLAIDDGVAETFIGDTGQLIWINRFTPAPAEFPFVLEQVDVIFGSTLVPIGGAIEIVIHEDTDGDGDPGTGAVLVGSHTDVVQFNDQLTFNSYTLAVPVLLNGPGDVLVGVINRYGAEGVNDFPAALDQTATQGRSWAATYLAGDAPANPTYPADEQWGTIDSFGFPGNWTVRASGSPFVPPPSVIEVPTLGRIGLLLLLVAVAVGGLVALRR